VIVIKFVLEDHKGKHYPAATIFTPRSVIHELPAVPRVDEHVYLSFEDEPDEVRYVVTYVSWNIGPHSAKTHVVVCMKEN